MKKLLSWLIILTLMLSPISYGQTKQTNDSPKQEVVYAKIDHTGAVDSLSVVNVFRLARDGVVTDFGEYESTTNLTNLESIEVKGDRIEVPAKAGIFYYQGNQPDRALPWLVDIDYFLDGKAVSAEELAGKTGELRLRLRISNNPEADPIFFEHYLLQVSLQFPQDGFHVLEAKDATEAISGEDKLLTYTVLPDKAADIELIASVRDFAMKPIMLNGLPFQMALELPDMDDSLGDLALLQDAIKQLNDGAQALADGLALAGSGGSELYGGADSLAGGGFQMSDGLDQFSEGLYQYQSGLEAYRDGVVAFDDGLGQLVDGIEQLSDGLNDYAAGSDQATDGLNQYIDGVNQYVGGVNQALDMIIPLINEVEKAKGILELIDFSEAIEQTKIASNRIDQALREIAEAIGEMDVSQFEAMKASSAQLLALLESIEAEAGAIPGLSDLISRLQAANGNLETQLQALETIAYQLRHPDLTALGVDPEDVNTQSLLAYMASQADQLDGVMAEIRAGTLHPVAGIISELIEFEAGLQDVLGGLSGLADAYRPIDDMIQGFDGSALEELKNRVLAASERYSELNEEFQRYLDEMGEELPAMIEELLANIDQAADGMNQLRDGGNSLVSGGEDIRAGFAQLNDGAHELAGGSDQLVLGARQIRDGSSGLTYGIRSLADNFRLMTGGSSEIAYGLRQLAGGIGAYRDGIGAYISGITQAGDGSRQLADGTDQLARETDGMDEQMKQQIEEMTEEFLPKDFDPVSFVSNKNTEVEVVQFVIMGQGINLTPEEAEEVVEEDDQTIWDRVVDLFKNLLP
ncbi:MAG TPA: hypothetical protein GXZ74_03715 [Tissierellia bacterium]|nr:hypothetical protein [Tissierellia bacterium]